MVRLFVSAHTLLPAGRFRSLQAFEELRFNKTYDPVRFAEEVNELGKCNLRYLHTGEEIAERLFCNPCCTYPCLQVLKIQSPIGRGPMGMVPRGMASLENLMKLCIWVKEFDKEGLQVLMGMPSLAHLQLRISEAINEKLTIGSNGFKLLKELSFNTSDGLGISEYKPDGLQLAFAPGAVPALRRLCLDLNSRWVASDFFLDLGVEHLSGLAQLEVNIQCCRAARGRVQGIEYRDEKAIILDPNREIHRVSEAGMFKDEKEWEEAVSKERKEWKERLVRLLDEPLARINET